jgi:hypothetical protein
MPRKPKVGLQQIDHAALLRCVAIYKKLSRAHSVELSAMILRDGWHAGAYYAARRLQQISLNLPPTSLAPCELRSQRIGGLDRIWPVDPRGLDDRRPETATILTMLLRCGLSRYEPHPQYAIDAAEQQHYSPPSDDAA